ncbi:hypothetical protein TanjilG_24879 [Lupinus angustifolius]|uniref:Uncharacterized protein n=1 Tax=Lupinus angustifolius TaxID=3871 RepID=A0A4P1R0F7_LUPAN|nr:hypothetical protein TanjilG_24879 [Lupinus angustifolius]
MESSELHSIPRISLRQHEELCSPKGSPFCASESSSVNGLGLLRTRLSCASSVPLSPTLVSSPERELSHVWNESEKFANSISQRKQQWEIPVFSLPSAPPSHRVSLSLSTLAPLLPRRKQWAAISALVVGQPVAGTRPPKLTPLSRPFVLLNPTTKVSHVELPISSQNCEGN